MVNKMNEQEIIKILNERLSPQRLQHSLNVASVARVLAQTYGSDPDKAFKIGLLHDYAKGLSGSELLAIATEKRLLEDETERLVPDLLHAKVGAYLLETELAINDPEILQAVRVHTLGALEMSLLDKIIFLADMIEPDRDYPGMERLQCLAGRDIDQAMLFAFDMTIRFCLEQGRILHPRTIMVRNKFLDNIK